jgi:alkylresorcinol/alkylpyrone synthase
VTLIFDFPYASVMSVIAGVHGVLPNHQYAQSTITEVFEKFVSPDGSRHRVIQRIHEAVGVQYRNLALPLDAYENLIGFGTTNNEFIRIAVDLGEQAIVGALKKSGFKASDVDLIISTSVTGIAVPAIDSRLIPRLGFRPDIKRLPLFGLGCIAGATGIARVHDYLLGDPDAIAILLSVELCSLTLQRDDLSMANIVASGLFGDGAAAVVIVGQRRALEKGLSGPKIISSRSRIYADSEDAIGWDISETGFHIVLSEKIPEMISANIDRDVIDFLSAKDLRKVDITTWICHPGGPKIITAVQHALNLADQQLDLSWKSLQSKGNLSSASILHLLQDTMYGWKDSTPPPKDSFGLVISMGPGFATEFVLLKW